MFKSIWDAPSTSDYFNSLWDTSDMADAWADYGDHAEDVWSDEDWDMTDVEADADTLASAGWGTDEDYGYYGGEDAAMEAGLFGWDA